MRENTTRFIVVSRHEITDVEDVVERHDRYVVVQKHPETWDIVQETDPRR